MNPYIATPPGRLITPRDVLNDIPSLRAGSPHTTWADLSGSVASTFELLKLHGSDNWYWVPKDQSGATLNRTGQVGHFGDPPVEDVEARRRELPGREPFIVPPLATKSEYYRNPIMREIWRRAAEALAAAEHIDLVGYSLPGADLVVGGMLDDATRGKRVIWRVVNPSPAGPVARIRQMGVDPDDICTIDGEDCVARFVATYRDRTAEVLVHRLRGLRPDGATGTALLVAWGHPQAVGGARRVATIHPAGHEGDVRLDLEASPPAGGATGARFDAEGRPSAERFPTLADLLGRLEGAKRLVTTMPDVGEVVLIDSSYVKTPTGAATTWLYLIPAGRPR